MKILCKRIKKEILSRDYITFNKFNSESSNIVSDTTSFLVSKFTGIELRLVKPVPGLNSCSK